MILVLMLRFERVHNGRENMRQHRTIFQSLMFAQHIRAKRIR